MTFKNVVVKANGSAPTRCNSFEFTQRLADDGKRFKVNESKLVIITV